jgi:hypothetical protein
MAQAIVQGVVETLAMRAIVGILSSPATHDEALSS